MQRLDCEVYFSFPQSPVQDSYLFKLRILLSLILAVLFFRVIGSPSSMPNTRDNLSPFGMAALLRRLIKRLRHISWRENHKSLTRLPGEGLRTSPQKPLLRSLRFSQRRLWVASDTVILGLQTKGFFSYLFIYLQVFIYFAKLK